MHPIPSQYWNCSEHPYLNTQQGSPGYASQKGRDVNPGFFPNLVFLVRVGLQREEINHKKMLSGNWNNLNPKPGTVFPHMKAANTSFTRSEFNP